MNKNKKKLWLVGGIVAVLLLGYFAIVPGVLYLLSWNPPLKGAGGSSDDISESKRRGVFLWEYQPAKNPIHIRDGEYLDIVEVWAERSWIYPEFSRDTKIQSKSYQIVMSVKPNGLTHYYLNNYDYGGADNKQWTVGIDYQRMFNTREDGKLVYEQQGQSLDSCEVFLIKQGNQMNKPVEPVILEKLKLCRKD